MMSETEIWKDIDGYDGMYQISNLGRIKSTKKWSVSKRKFVDNQSILHPTDNGYGYLIIGLRKQKTRKIHYVHRLVADAFLEKKDGAVVNHIDFNKKNNAVTNLEWCSQRENVLHSVEHMKKRRTVCHSSTGEMYIYRRGERFRVSVDKKEKTFSSLADAIRYRDVALKGGGVNEVYSE